MKKVVAGSLLSLGLLACQPPTHKLPEAVSYRDLSTHPGCTTAGLDTLSAPYTPASIPGYTCSAKEYAFPAGVSEDTTKPIVLLIHGNSSTPADYETFSGDTNHTPMLSERLVALGFKTYAVDLRIDKVDDPQGNNTTENAARNIDHGWAVPIAQSFIDAVIKANPNRKISIVGFSLGSTVARDAVRRLYAAGKDPFSHIKAMVLASGSNHGVSTYQYLCPGGTASNPTMRGRVACELGDREAYTPTPFLADLNGDNGAWETPCADGSTAYGSTGVCGGNKVQYVTIVMQDISAGKYQDEFVSQASAALQGATNKTTSLTDQDPTGYFYGGIFKNHFGAIRSANGLDIIMSALSN